ncbi:MAG: alpha/beta hydrolase [Pseudomonadota bacterium]
MTTLMPDCETRTITVDGDRLFVRMMGRGPPLLLLHGYPQTSVMWHRVAPNLADQYTLVMPDLPGYGQSDAPASGPERYSKRRMAADCAAVMAALGHVEFGVVGHDRGARVAYRMALDHPGRVKALVVMDIVPTIAMWARFTAERALVYYHWTFLAQPAPLPETLIGHDPAAFIDMLMARWTKAGNLSPMHPEALAEYHAAFAAPERHAATCEDYRAGATIDGAHDAASRNAGQLIGCPTQVLWGGASVASGVGSPLDIWRPWAPGATGASIDCGHFLCEEAPAETLAHLVPFLARHAA